MSHRDIQNLLDVAAGECRHLARNGRQADYIPELAKADPALFSISAVTVGGEVRSSGDCGALFSMQSMSKVIALAYAIETFGEAEVFARVGMEPCSEPFNSIMKLEMTSAMPLNPFINAGAIVVAGMIAERAGGRALRDALAFASRMAGSGGELAVCERVYASEKATADRNRALAYFMHSVGTLRSDVEETLDLYFKLCGIEVNTPCLAAIGATLANGGVNPFSDSRVISLETAYIVIGLMSVCGLYDESGEFAVKVGVPAKSGVSGGIMCAVPGRMGIAVFSPPLDAGGNSVAGVAALSKLSRDLKLRGI